MPHVLHLRVMANLSKTSHSRVLVAFSGRRLAGLIVEAVPYDASAIATRELSPVERVLDEQPVVSLDMISLLSQAARDSLCPVGLALHHALPPGTSPRVVHRLGLTRRGRAALEGTGTVRGTEPQWWTARGSNPRPRRCERRALPSELAALFFVAAWWGVLDLNQ